MAKKQRLTDRLNLALAEAEAAISVGKHEPDHAQKACQLADDALGKARQVLAEIMRAAEAI